MLAINLKGMPEMGHTHGSDRPCKIRCGANEGLIVSTSTRSVTEVFTDGLRSCVQIILGNDRAVFTCHIADDSPEPIVFVQMAYTFFKTNYGNPTVCELAWGEVGKALADIISDPLVTLAGKLTRFPKTDGRSINVSNRTTKETPDSGWEAYAPGVAGWATARDVIECRLTSPEKLGKLYNGDWRESCRRCNVSDYV